MQVEYDPELISLLTALLQLPAILLQPAHSGSFHFQLADKDVDVARFGSGNTVTVNATGHKIEFCSCLRTTGCDAFPMSQESANLLDDLLTKLELYHKDTIERLRHPQKKVATAPSPDVMMMSVLADIGKITP